MEEPCEEDPLGVTRPPAVTVGSVADDGVGRRRRGTTKHRVSLPLLGNSAMAARVHGTRALHKRLRIPQWKGVNGEPECSTVAVSQAAVLFDVAYAASLATHAHVLVLPTTTWSVSAAVGIFLCTALPTVLQWWNVSLFLCRYDPGDLVNEYILVGYMVLVVGQSLTIRECATCLLSQNTGEPCHFSSGTSASIGVSYQPCATTATFSKSAHAATWPMLPFHCWAYALLSIIPRVIHLANILRAVRDVQKQGKRDAALEAVEHALILPLCKSACKGLTALCLPLALSPPPLPYRSLPCP